MSWKQYTLSSWQQFHDQILGPHVTVASPLRASYIYRGQPRTEWTLSPSYSRLCARLGYEREKAIEIEKLLLRRFKDRAHLYLEQRFLPPGVGSLIQTASLSDWWSLMQHYRAPTRLLDWSHSPLVGLYFATNAEWDSDGALWCLHRRSLYERADAKFGEPPAELTSNEMSVWWSDKPQGRVFAFDHPRPTERMVAQQGTFTIAQDVLLDHATGLADVLPESEDEGSVQKLMRRKYTIPAASKPEFLRYLHQMNVTAAALFPGIDGFGSEMDEIVRLG